MKRFLTIVGSTIVSLILTFVLAELLSLYHFGTVPTILTIIYLVSFLIKFVLIVILIYY